jgi:hypothetical protein
MGEVIQLFKDRRQAPPVRTRAQVAEHLIEHGQYPGSRMRLPDLHDLHDALHEMVSTHQHGA